MSGPLRCASSCLIYIDPTQLRRLQSHSEEVPLTGAAVHRPSKLSHLFEVVSGYSLVSRFRFRPRRVSHISLSPKPMPFALRVVRKHQEHIHANQVLRA